jgi:hypothetical protein
MSRLRLEMARYRSLNFEIRIHVATGNGRVYLETAVAAAADEVSLDINPMSSAAPSSASRLFIYLKIEC